jgi:NAD(P)H-dependent FMN reductase
LFKIAILTASVRTGRKSDRVALFFKNLIEAEKLGTVEMLDLAAYKFPVFDERLKFLKSPPPQVLDFAAKINNADGVIIVTPEYNGGYPASLKNVVDLLSDGWRKKPVAISTVSSGAFGGSQVLTAIQFSLWKLGALTVPAMFPVPNIETSFNEDGKPADNEKTVARARKFLEELKWCMEAKQKMTNR